MRTLTRFSTLGLFLAVALWGCDANGPASASLSSSGGYDYEDGYAIEGSVFINDEDEVVDEREPNELGIAEVRVDLIYTPNGEFDESEDEISVLTDSTGRYTAVVPYPGMWTVRVTRDDTPVDETEVFNPTLFDSYVAVSETERVVTVEGEIVISSEEAAATADFAFEPDLGNVLRDLTVGSFVTGAEQLRVWRRWMRHAAAERNDCPNDTNWICRDRIEFALRAIFDEPGDDRFFGNSEPFALEEGEDVFEVANDILAAKPRTEEGELVQELLVAELNFFTGLGSPNRNYDRTLLRYLEVYVGAQINQEAGSGAQSLSSARVVVGDQLEVTRAYNRGGGGGGEVGD